MGFFFVKFKLSLLQCAYTKLYSGGEPEFIEGDVFKIIIPLTTGSMTKVGPETSFDKSGQAGGQVSGQAGDQAGGQAVTVKLEATRLAELFTFTTLSSRTCLDIIPHLLVVNDVLDLGDVEEKLFHYYLQIGVDYAEEMNYNTNTKQIPQ